MILKRFVPVVRHTLLAAAMLLLVGADGSSPIAEFACPKPGTHFTLSTPVVISRQPERHIRVLIGERQGFDCHVLGDSAGNYRLHAGLVDSSQPIEWRAAAESLWPLRVGNKSHTHAQYDGEVWMMDYEVVAFEKVTARVGVFNAYKVIATVRVGGKPSSTATLWWSPDLSFTLSYQLMRADNRESESWEIAALGESEL